ncbi:MAG: hypothetical protein K2G20_05020, partial [Lachnospiraceae bacterium]|nr:hypothetical protein [Lachnospiraceae bacterium]
MTDNKKLDLILEKVNSLDEKVNNLDKKVSSLDERVNNLEGDMKEVRQRVTKTDMTLENEIRVNIQRIAEGHLDLSRKLDDCVKISSDIKAKQEIQDIYIN